MKLTLPKSLQSMFKKKSVPIFAGISLHADCIKVVKLEKVEQGFKCIFCKNYDLAKESQAIARLEEIITDAKLVGVPVVIVIPGKQTQGALIELSDVPEVEPQAALPWKIKDLVAYSPQDILCDYIEMTLQPLGQSEKAQVVATSRAYIERLIEPFHQAKVPIKAITTEQFAIARLQQSEDSAQLAFIQHRDSDAILLILKNQEIGFARKIRGADLLVNMPQDELRHGGADHVIVEIQRSIDFYESQLKQPPIKHVFVAMAGNNDACLVEVLNGSLPVKTVLLPLDGIEDTTDQLGLAYIASTGAAFYCFDEESAS